ncbi:unnamed protein product [Allacma fusca]|uniref:Uncharacterized protein n=1 Tax=Allacma fusca TaxID=39272 RepID=A0A8J2P086_9HEXA|nr:unnamed protein product [Allacma fusca]
MSNNCFRTRSSKGRRKRFKITGSGFPDIPAGPTFKTKIRGVDYDFEERKHRYRHLIPVYTLQQVQRLTLSYHELLMKTLMEHGYKSVVDELVEILGKENKASGNCEHTQFSQPNQDPLISQPNIFKRIAETLKFAQDLDDMDKPEHAVLLRKDLAVFMMQDRRNWIARHLLETCLVKADSLGDTSDRTEAECHCFIAYLAMNECDLNQNSIEENLLHLKICRELSENQRWNLRTEVVILRIKKPIYIHGFRDEEQLIDGSSMHIYNIATLLEHELLIKLVDQLLFKDIITRNDVLLAAQYTDDALNLAIEVHESEAMSAALVRFGNILLGMGCFDEAMEYFEELQLQAELRQDRESEAMGFHGLGCSFNGKRETACALEMFAVQLERAEGIFDLEAEACEEIGMTLLSEGQTLEAKASLWMSGEKFEEGKDKYKTPKTLLDDSWALAGLALGLELWGRYSGLTRRRSVKDIRAIIEFKNLRKPLPKVKRPKYKGNFVDQSVIITDTYPSEATLQSFRPFMTREEGRIHVVQRRVARDKADPNSNNYCKPKKGDKKGVLFTSHYITSSSPEYDSLSHSGSSQSPPSIFDVDVPFKSDANREDAPSDDGYRSGHSEYNYSEQSPMSSKTGINGMKGKSLNVLSTAKGLQKSLMAFSGGSSHSPGLGNSPGSGQSLLQNRITLLSLGSMNQIPQNYVEKQQLIGLAKPSTRKVSGSKVRTSAGANNAKAI